MANAKFIQTSSGVTLEFDNDMGERVTRCFFVAGSKGGYVKEWDNRGGASQVCGKLRDRGYTLVSTHEGLLALIKREWNAAKRANLSHDSHVTPVNTCFC